MSDTTAEELETEQAMFVHTARGTAFADGVLTLSGVTPATLYFADRPERDAGHLATSDFVDLWGAGENSFEEDPPNAVLSFLSPGGDVPDDVVVVISQPTLSGDSLTYAVELVEGTIPASSGPATLFIDPFGRPMSPVSVCGVRRRGRRRGRRRAMRRGF